MRIIPSLDAPVYLMYLRTLYIKVFARIFNYCNFPLSQKCGGRGVGWSKANTVVSVRL